MNRKKVFAIASLAIFALASGGRAAAQDSTDQDIKLFRKDLRSLRKQIIAENMSLSDKEAEQFWPLFDRYTQELIAKQDRKYGLLKEYAGNYTTMTDEQAEKYVLGRADVEEGILQVRQKFFPLFRKVLSGKSSALFFQLDWRLGLIMDLQLGFANSVGLSLEKVDDYSAGPLGLFAVTVRLCFFAWLILPSESRRDGDNRDHSYRQFHRSRNSISHKTRTSVPQPSA